MIRRHWYLFVVVMFAGSLLAQSTFAQPSEFRLHFRKDDRWRVQISEQLRLMMHFPQVEKMDAKPSVRTTDYSFTYAIDSVCSDGSAIIGATLDSFKTDIKFGEGKHAEDFFHFSSTIDWDLEHSLRDIKTLPRAQFLGQTLRFTMRPDGIVQNFENLDAFHQNAVGKGYDYDMVHAMLSLSDSVRMSQLLELGFGGLAAADAQYRSQTTATEIPIMRSVTVAKSGKNALHVTATYDSPPPRIEYLEGIATPMGILKFYGAGLGDIQMKDRFLKHSSYRDTANVLLSIDIDTVPEEITRLVTTEVTPIPVMRVGTKGATITIKEIEVHQAEPPPADTTGGLPPEENPIDRTKHEPH